MEQLLFIQDIIPPINHTTQLKLIRKKSKIKHEADRENRSRVNYDYQALYQSVLKNKQTEKQETIFKGPIHINKMRTNGTLKLQIIP